jgi:phosphoglycolate phosphatase-like HAD superfamily hydrolase
LNALRRLKLVDAMAEAEAGEMLMVGDSSSDVRGMKLARL